MIKSENENLKKKNDLLQFQLHEEQISTNGGYQSKETDSCGGGLLEVRELNSNSQAKVSSVIQLDSKINESNAFLVQ